MGAKVACGHKNCPIITLNRDIARLSPFSCLCENGENAEENIKARSKDRAFMFLAEKEGFEPSRRLPDLLP